MMEVERMNAGSGSPGVVSDVADGVGVVSFARPERLNALTAGVTETLLRELQRLGDRDDVRAVVLRGEGRAFCAGLDLEAGMADADEPDEVAAINRNMRLSTEVIWTMRRIPQPVIAAVHGHAVGAGFAYAAAADVRFVGQHAVFSAPFLKLGMTVGDLGLSWFLPRLIGQARASELFFSAGSFDAAAAVDAGLASRVSDDPLGDAMDYAQRLAGFPQYGVQASKDLMNASSGSSLRDHLDSESRAQVIGSQTRDAKQAMEAALKR